MATSLVWLVWDTFWSPKFWLPADQSWANLKSTSSAHYANFTDIFYALPLSVAFICLRYSVERFVLLPIGLAYGLKHSKVAKSQITHNPLLEEAYRKSRRGKLDHKQVQGLAKQLDCSERKVERWIRVRRCVDRPSKLTKFMECGWRFFYYLAAFSYGVWVLWDKPWLMDISHVWINYPHHEVTPDTWWYYILSQSSYWSFLISHFKDVKRKDFWEMFIHHVATLFLLIFSWTLNFHRIGTLVLVIHDCADIFLEGAKMTKYIRWQRVCDVLFATFTFTWIVTRLGIFPFWIVRSTTFEACNFLPLFPAFYFMNCLLFVLLFLHIIWTYFIFKVLYGAVLAGQAEKDSRSSSSDNLSDENDKSDTLLVTSAACGELRYQNHSN